MKPLIATAAIALTAAATAQPAQSPAPLPVTTPIAGAGGKQLGTVTLTPAPTGVLIRIAAKGLTPGWHGMHFHAVGDCSDEGFKKSGAHINHAEHKMPHGLLNPAGPDFGDLPNIYATADGTANAEVFTTLVRLGGSGEKPNLTDTDGSALVLHANADDHSTQPIGGAGDRVGCAVIKG